MRSVMSLSGYAAATGAKAVPSATATMLLSSLSGLMLRVLHGSCFPCCCRPRLVLPVGLVAVCALPQVLLLVRLVVQGLECGGGEGVGAEHLAQPVLHRVLVPRQREGCEQAGRRGRRGAGPWRLCTAPGQRILPGQPWAQHFRTWQLCVPVVE